MGLSLNHGPLISRDTIYSFLQKCIPKKNLLAGRLAHSIMVSESLDCMPVLGDFLIQLYALCGSLAEANAVFCRTYEPSLHTWHAIISAHVKLGAPKEAFTLYHEMSNHSIAPNRFIFLCILKACCNVESVPQGMDTHVRITLFGMETDVVICTTLVYMYVKCGHLEEAHHVFFRCPHADSVLWGTLISGYVQHGQDLLALEYFEKMQEERLNPDRFSFSCILKACGNVKSLVQGMDIHNRIMAGSLESDKVIVSTLVDMYVKCGLLEEACKVFESSPIRDNVQWSSMIAGFAQHEQGSRAIEVFSEMQKEGIHPDKVMYTSALKACLSIRDPTQGRLLQENIIRAGLEQDEAIGNALIDMYSHFGSLDDAEKVFEGMNSGSVVSWNTMIATYGELGHEDLSIEMFKQMQREGLLMDNISIASTLKACTSLGTLEEGRLMHLYVMKTSNESGALIGNSLVDMYAKCGSIDEACNMFDKLVNKDVVSWNALISGSVQHGYDLLALALFAEMQGAGLKPDRVTILSIAKASSSIGSPPQSFLVHFQVLEERLGSDVFVGSALIDMYCKCGALEDAQKTFDLLPNKNVVSWNSIIAGYAQQGHGSAALDHFGKMAEKGLKPDAVTFLCALKASGMVGEVLQGMLIHVGVIVEGHDFDDNVANTLVDMYAKSASMHEAQHIFHSLSRRNVVSWNAMIGGHAGPEHGHVALELFRKMQRAGVQPDSITFSCVVKACCSIGLLKEGQHFHAHIVKLGLESSSFIVAALLDMYANGGFFEEAQKLLRDSTSCDLVSCNEMVSKFVNHGQALPALSLFEDLQGDGLQPDKITYSSILRACTDRESLEQGRIIHDQMTRSGIELDQMAMSTLVDMYAKCGSLVEAQQVFDQWPSRDIVMWSSMIGGYVLHDHCLSALELFSSFLQEGLQPDQVMLACALKACRRVGAVGYGMQLHDQIIRLELELSAITRSSLIDMYGKLGSLDEAKKVFGDFEHQTLESWTAVIAGYAKHGNSELAQKCMESMQEQGWKPDEKTYTSILAGCSHTADVDEGHQNFQSMSKDHGMAPSIEHFNCMVDLLGRSGRLDEAEKILQTLPPTKAFAGWVSLLAACKTFGDSRLGRRCFSQLAQLNLNGAAGYALIADIFVESQIHDSVMEASSVEVQRMNKVKPVEDSYYHSMKTITSLDGECSIIGCTSSVSRFVVFWPEME